LKETVSDNPMQVKRLEEIERLEENWHSQVTEPQINMRRRVAENHVATERFKQISSRTVGKEMFDGFRESLSEVNAKLNSENDQKGLLIAQDILLAMVNQETGQRGFLLSG